jgi:hypothetical protein
MVGWIPTKPSVVLREQEEKLECVLVIYPELVFASNEAALARKFDMERTPPYLIGSAAPGSPPGTCKTNGRISL